MALNNNNMGNTRPTGNGASAGNIFTRPIGGGSGKSGGPKGVRGKMPVKQSINLVIIDENKIQPVKAIVAIAIIVFLAGLFSKFMVIDRLTAMSQATNQVSQLRSTLASTQKDIESFGEIRDTYAHYTYSGMTDEELSRVDRAAVLELADEVFETGKVASNWRLSGNVLTAQVRGKTLEELNLLAQLVETYPIVDRCALTNADKTVNNEKISGVTASLTIYLQQPVEEGGDQ